MVYSPQVSHNGPKTSKTQSVPFSEVGQSRSGHVIFQAQKPSKAHSSDKTYSFSPNFGYFHIQSPFWKGKLLGKKA